MALIYPHGSRQALTPVLLTGSDNLEERKRAKELARVQVTPREAGDLVMLGIGAFSPLSGFMGQQDYDGVVEEMKLRRQDAGVMWPLPVTLAVHEKTFREGDTIALYDQDELIATMKVEEIFQPDKRKECERCFMGNGTMDIDEFWQLAEQEHPGVHQVLRSGKYYVGGPVTTLTEGRLKEMCGKAFLAPAIARQVFEDRGWSTVVAFETRSPMHRSQEYICKVAQELFDGLLIHAAMGALKSGEIPEEIRFKCYTALIDKYMNREHTLLAVHPMGARYAGPREALLHAVVLQNFGCSHLLVGRDHAGVGDFYGLFEAQGIFDILWPGALAIQPLKIDWAFWSFRNNGMATLKTCATEEPSDRVLVSGTKLQRLLAEGKVEDIPSEYSRPEVLEVLAAYYQDKKFAER